MEELKTVLGRGLVTAAILGVLGILGAAAWIGGSGAVESGGAVVTSGAVENSRAAETSGTTETIGTAETTGALGTAGHLKTVYIVPWLQVIWLISTLGGGVAAGWKTRRRGWLVGGLAGLAWGMLLAVFGLELFEGIRPGSAAVLLGESCVLGIIGGSVGINCAEVFPVLTGGRGTYKIRKRSQHW